MSNEPRPKIVVITGPTASGKTSLAVALAARLDGEIVNADSMQVYRGMDVGTAKPTIQEREGIPHHLMDVVHPDEPFNAAIYRTHAMPVIRDIVDREKRCFVVGGTGLYIKTLLGGLAACPPSNGEIRKALRDECEKKGPLFLHNRLKAGDPVSAAKIHPNDRVRIIRALEIMQLTGEPVSVLFEKHRFKEKTFDVLKICLELDREVLYDRINRRSRMMIDEGLIEETQDLLNRGYSPALKSMQSLGYRHMIKYLNKMYTLDEAIHELRKDTRRYAKRQMTWFRADPEMAWIDPMHFEKILKRVSDHIRDTS